MKGIGLGLRRPFAAELVERGEGVDWLEVTPENWAFFGGATRKLLEEVAARFPLLPHSVSLSIGGPDPLDEAFLDAVGNLCRRWDAPWWSDHLCYSTAGGKQLHDLLPLPFTSEAVEHVAARVRGLAERVGAELVLENATYYAQMPGAEMDEAAFLCAVQQETGVGLLLDVNNVYVNSLNHGFDAEAFIDRMPLGAVRQLHVAGHTRQGETVIDTHIGPVPEPVWSLYRHTLRRAGRLIPTLIEWDQELPSLEVLLGEVQRARVHAFEALKGPTGDVVAP